MYTAKKLVDDKEARRHRGMDTAPEMFRKYKTLDEHAIVRDAETGKLVLAYAPDVLSGEVIDNAVRDLADVAILSPFRGEAAGKVDVANLKRNLRGLENVSIDPGKSASWAKIRRKSTGSRAALSNYTQSGNIGYYKKVQSNEIRPPERDTPEIREFLRESVKVMKEYVPDVFKELQSRVPMNVRYGGKDIPLTTVTVNRDFRTSFHTDKGNMNGYGILTATYLGEPYKGARLVFPQYGLMVPLERGDVLVANVGELLHGNEPIELPKGGGRISFVLYARENLGNLRLGSPGVRRGEPQAP